MKLRSDSRMEAASGNAIPFTHPETHSIYISNASSTLLRQPQELKDRIYYFVHAGHCIHVDYHPHQTLHDKRIRLSTCMRKHCDNPYYYLPKAELPVTFLRTCRQVYHEARNVFYATNIFRIGDPSISRLFSQRISLYSFTLRSVHLTICVTHRHDERQWDNALHELAKNVKTVQNVYIDVREHLWDERAYYNFRHTPTLGKRPFLGGLLELKKLPLKTFEISVGGDHLRRYVQGQWQSNMSVYVWTTDQKREWARSMKSAILGRD